MGAFWSNMASTPENPTCTFVWNSQFGTFALTSWVYFSQIWDPRSQFIYWNPICTLIVWLAVWLGHLQWNNNVLGVFWSNIGPSKAFICWNLPCSFLWEVVQILDHLSWITITCWVHFPRQIWDLVHIYLLISHLHICEQQQQQFTIHGITYLN